MITRRRFCTAIAAIGAVAARPSGANAAMTGSGSLTGAGTHGFHVPEEALPHERTFMQWPVSPNVHPDRLFLGMLQDTIADIANAISEFEPVVMLMDRQFERAARRNLSDAVEIWDIATDDLWCRDSGPLFVVNDAGELAVSHINFNGWGGKQIHRNDGKIARAVADRLDLRFFDNGLVGEPGGVETDGEGTLIAHESSWVNPNRNAGSKDEVEAKLLDAYGAEKLVWAPGIAGADITDYHIDALARFVEPGRIVIQMPPEIDPHDPWSKAAFQTRDILERAKDAKGRKFDLALLPEPYDTRIRSQNFVASYVNYYVCNGGVIAAQFGDRRADEEAHQVLVGLYPDREIVMLDTDPVGEVGGGIHCATCQQPAI